MTAAISAARTKGTYLRGKFHRLKARMGTERAAMAIAHEILVAAFHMLHRAVAFADLGADHLDRLDEHRTARRSVRRLDAPSRDAMLRPRPRVDLAMPRRPPAPGPPPWIFGPAPISPHLRAFRQLIPATTCHTAGRPRAWASSCRARGNR